MSSLKAVFVASALLAADLVAGHGVITNATGDQCGSGAGMGMDPSVPRDCPRRQPCQLDSTRFKAGGVQGLLGGGDPMAKMIGETLKGGTNNIETGTKNIMEMTGTMLPQVSQGGQVKMTLHQVNADGGGPYMCSINSDGTGMSWQPVQVSTNVPGRRGNNRATSVSDLPLVAEVPQGQTCTGTVNGQSNICLMRCMNQAAAGPFGGTVPIQMAGAAGANGNSAANGATTANGAATANGASTTKGAGAAKGATDATANGLNGIGGNNGAGNKAQGATSNKAQAAAGDQEEEGATANNAKGAGGAFGNLLGGGNAQGAAGGIGALLGAANKKRAYPVNRAVKFTS